MTKRVLIQAQEFEKAAERAGGYVAPPGSFKVSDKGHQEFTAIRQYSLRSGKPMSKLTTEDYKKIGIEPAGK